MAFPARNIQTAPTQQTYKKLGSPPAPELQVLDSGQDLNQRLRHEPGDPPSEPSMQQRRFPVATLSLSQSDVSPTRPKQYCTLEKAPP
ncbi:hypothetical protein COLINT_03201 [Collinsella intestinalis DSM 13280]|uniref:Uncharacterized protein n=1 Tax=Collinsella intestinalis DSM 13280 TaxID=521003 RepID=C4FAV5_9ACTN|nr:hypothetical protein COLINT_03201 [Collinsella intestinalis DSM 13280]